MSTTTEKSNAANLARIRDNQRRSRARRKEYLQELESRLRQCELQGIEASAEIQSAARRVADENRKLRSLLLRHGIGEESVDAFLRDDAMLGANVGWDGGLGGGEAVRILETLLNTKRSCYGDANATPVTMNPMSAHHGGGSTTRSETVQWDAASARRHSSQAKYARDARSTPFLTPSSTGSPMSRATTHRRSPSVQDQPGGGHGSLLPGIHSRTSTSGHTSPDPQLHLFDFDDQFGISSVYPPPPTTTTSSTSPSHHSQHPSGRHASSVYGRASSNGAGMPCGMAAEMIASMGGGGGHPLDVRADLGCMPPQDLDCEVDNQVVFSVMDRYSGAGIGL